MLWTKEWSVSLAVISEFAEFRQGEASIHSRTVNVAGKCGHYVATPSGVSSINGFNIVKMLLATKLAALSE